MEINKNLFRINEEFWVNKIDGYNDIIDPYQGVYEYLDADKRGENSIGFNLELSAKLKDLCGNDELNVFSFLLSCLFLTLKRNTTKASLPIVTPAIKDTLKCEAPLFLKFEQEEDILFKELLIQSREEVILAIKHQQYDFESVNSKLKASGNLVLEVFPFAFRYKNIQENDSPLSSIVSFTAEINQEGKLLIQVDATANYDELVANSLLKDFEFILKSILEDPRQHISKYLDKKNGTENSEKGSIGDTDQSLVDFWNSRPHINSNHPAIIFKEETFLFNDLNEKIEKLAYHLQSELKIGKGDNVAILLSDPVQMTISAWAVLKVGATYVPINHNFPDERRRFILEDTQAKLIISTSDFLFELGGYNSRIFGIDVELESLQSGSVKGRPDPEDLAYIIYTSGSSGTPKGVMVKHKSLTNLILDQSERMRVSGSDRILNMLPYSFDVAHYHMLLSMLSGACLVDLGSSFDLSPESFYEFLKSNKVTISGIPPAYLAALDCQNLSFLRVVYTGGEAPNRINIDTLLENNIRVFNQYGLTETTCTSLMYEFNKVDYANIIPIGTPILNTKAYIFNEHLHPTSFGNVGEIYISGKGLAAGYLNNPDLTSQKFIESPFGNNETLFKTGDLGRRLPSGDIEFIGRADRQVKVRGHRIELSEIENILLKREGVKSAVVDTIESNDQNELVAYFVTEDEQVKLDLNDFAKKYLPAYMIPSCFIKLEEIPVTLHGKVDYVALKKLDKAKTIDSVTSAPPRNQQEQKLLDIWKEVLGKENIGIHDNFFEIGGHSLRATQVASLIYKRLKLNIDLGVIFSNATIALLSEAVDAVGSSENDEIIPVEPEENYAVSNAQKRLWILDQLHNTNAYNIPGAYVFYNIDVEPFKKAFLSVIERQESLRTTFDSIDGEPRQKIHDFDPLSTPIEEKDIASLDDRYEKAKELVLSESNTSFDLEKGPLFRAKLLKVEKDRYIFIFTMHHIISDGWSMMVLVNEIKALYHAYQKNQDNPLQPLKIQYKDFAEWQNKRIEKSKDEAFWLNKLSDGVNLVDLPYDYPKTALATFNGSTEGFKISSEKVEALKKIANKNNCTLSVVVFSIYNILLNQLSGQNEICVAMTVANRTHTAIEKIVGYFANLIIIKTDINEDLSFDELVAQVRDHLVEAISHQNYPFDLLVEKLNPHRDNDYQPLFNVAYTYQNQQNVNISMDVEVAVGEQVVESEDSIKMTNFNVESKGVTAKFEILLFVEETDEGIDLIMEYNTDLFSSDKIKHFLKYFDRVIDSLIQAN